MSQMNQLEHLSQLTRRSFLTKSAAGLGTAALASIDARTGHTANTAGLPNLPHHQPKAKRAIYLFMSGAPSQIDMWGPQTHDATVV